MNRIRKIAPVIIVIGILIGWLLFRPSTDQLHPNDPRVNTILTFDVPMVYVRNCSQCSLSSRAQDANVFLFPQTSLYNTTGFLDSNSVVSQVGKGNQFTVQEVFTNHPHGIETLFRGESTYMIIKDQQGIVSIVSEKINKIIEFDTKNYTEETKSKLRMIDAVSNMDVFWIFVKLNPYLSANPSSTSLPDNTEERKNVVANIENEFLKKFPKDQILQYKPDPYHPRVYLQLDKKDALLYLQAEQSFLNINLIGLYEGEGDPVVSQ